MKQRLLAALAVIVAMSFTLPSSAFAQEKKMEKTMKAEKMRYIVRLPHTEAECLANLDAVVKEQPKLLEKIEWACPGGDHTGYVVLEGENEEAVRMMLPKHQRKDAKIAMVTKLTPEQIKKYHEKMK